MTPAKMVAAVRAVILWSYIVAIWVYCLVWIFIEGCIKLRVYRHLGIDTRRHHAFLQMALQLMGPHGVYGPRDAYGRHSGK